MIPRGTRFKFEFLGEFEIEIKNILEHESGTHMGLIHEKKPEAKNLVLLYLSVGYGLMEQQSRAELVRIAQLKSYFISSPDRWRLETYGDETNVSNHRQTEECWAR